VIAEKMGLAGVLGIVSASGHEKFEDWTRV